MNTAPCELAPPRRARSPENGFSLIEVLTAASVLLLLTVSTVVTLIPVSRQNRMTREFQEAEIQARNVLEKIQSTPFDDITTLYAPGQVIPLPGLENGEITVNYEDPNTDPLVVQVLLSWQSDDVGSMSRAFFTVRTR